MKINFAIRPPAVPHGLNVPVAMHRLTLCSSQCLPTHQQALSKCLAALNRIAAQDQPTTDPSPAPALVSASPTRVGWVKPSRDLDRRAFVLALKGLGKFTNFILLSMLALYTDFWMYQTTMQRWTLLLRCPGRGRNLEDGPLMKAFDLKCIGIVLRNDMTPQR